MDKTDVENIKFRLSLPPSVNHSHKQWVSNGRIMRVPTNSTKEWRIEAQLDVIAATKEQKWKCTKQSKVVVELTIWWPDKRKRDSHNLIKEICDALNKRIYDDDYWALPRIIDFGYDKHDPHVDIFCYLQDNERF